jgi:hypothetical protein
MQRVRRQADQHTPRLAHGAQRLGPRALVGLNLWPRCTRVRWAVPAHIREAGVRICPHFLRILSAVLSGLICGPVWDAFRPTVGRAALRRNASESAPHLGRCIPHQKAMQSASRPALASAAECRRERGRKPHTLAIHRRSKAGFLTLSQFLHRRSRTGRRVVLTRCPQGPACTRRRTQARRRRRWPAERDPVDSADERLQLCVSDLQWELAPVLVLKLQRS